MKFEIDEKIFEQFHVNIGVVIAKNINNKWIDEEIINLFKEQQEKIKNELVSSELSQHPKISCWRKAYSSFGAKPKKYKCCIEALIRQILDSRDIGHINKLVDLYNYLSLKYMVPMGADDLDKIDGNVKLTFAIGDERYQELGKSEIKNPKPEEVVYKDDKEILCRRWNWRECDKTRLTEETVNAIIYIEGFEFEEIKKAVNETAELIKEKFGGTTEIKILNKENPFIEVI